jgi:hypothetical protein
MVIKSNQKENMAAKPRFADFNNTANLYNYVFPTQSSLRYYVFYSAQNGLDHVISRLGKKLIFDLDKLDLWLAQGGAK